MVDGKPLLVVYGDDAPDLYWNMTKQYIKLFREGGWFDSDNNLPES